jgi:hypothetical protein
VLKINCSCLRDSLSLSLSLFTSFFLLSSLSPFHPVSLFLFDKRAQKEEKGRENNKSGSERVILRGIKGGRREKEKGSE